MHASKTALTLRACKACAGCGNVQSIKVDSMCNLGMLEYLATLAVQLLMLALCDHHQCSPEQLQWCVYGVRCSLNVCSIIGSDVP